MLNARTYLVLGAVYFVQKVALLNLLWEYPCVGWGTEAAHCCLMFCVIVKSGLRSEVFISSINNPFCWHDCIIIIILHLRVGLGTVHFLSAKPNIFIPSNYMKV